ncbi:MAG: efflux RND transporter permease subunit [Calditrichaeota bacterium]|nr:MAG: efflux RND transporter permease subunit [Calditrichota bacterium]
MRLPKLAIDNHQFTIVMMALLVFFGISAFFTMPRSEDPQFKLPITLITAVYPGANPLDLEKMVADPIEEAVNEIEDIKKYETVIRDGLVFMRIEFYGGVDPDEKEDEVREKVNGVRDELPEELYSLEVEQATPQEVNIFQIALVSDSASYRELEQEAEQLKKILERVPGIRRVHTLAYPEQQVRVSLDMEKAARLGIPLSRVIQAVRSENASIPGGSMDLGGKRFIVETSGGYDSLEEIGNTVVHAAGGRVVFLRDIASITYHHRDETYLARLNGRPAVFVTAEQKAGSNIFRIMKAVRRRLEAFRRQLPAHIQAVMVFDQSRSVAHRLDGFFSNLLQGIFLVGLVVLFAMGLRASAIVILAIPMSILIALGFVDLSGYAIQQMTIVGLVIALGLLVDNAIVVTENVSRFLRMGYPAREAAVRGTAQIGWPVVSATLTTVLAFLPIAAMQSTTGSFIRSMPLTVTYALLASLLISLSLTPYLSSKFLRIRPEKDGRLFQRLIRRLIEGPYRKTLGWALTHPVRVVMITVGVFLGSLALFPLVGVSLFPKAEKPQFLINIDLPDGTSLWKTDAVARQVEAVVARLPEVQHYATNVGHGNPQVYYNTFPAREKSNHAQLFVQLKPRYALKTGALVEALRDTLSHIPGAKIQVKEFEQGPPVDAPISIKIIGDDLGMLSRLARDVEEVIASTEGAIDVNNPLSTAHTNLHVNINRTKASLFGVPTATVDQTVRAAIAGLPISRFRDAGGEEYDIVVRLPFRERPTVRDFDRVYVASVTGQLLPLNQVARLEFKAGPTRIDHFNLERTAKVTANVAAGYSVDRVTRKIIDRLERYPWPEGYRYYVAGELESRQEAFGGLTTAIVIAMIAILGVLVLQFRSYIQPVIVFAAIPVAVVGSILALLITGYTFSFTAFVGLTSLVGIVINNAIILVDYTNQLRREGKDVFSALREAGETRLTPILLTTATTVGGLLPLTLRGGTMWAPMGWTIIGGLIVSTALTLIVVPVLYRLLVGRD